MSSLISTNDAALLGAMMATIGAIWAISLAAYQFIYRYFEETHREGLDKVKSLMDHGGKDPETLKWLHDRRTFYARKLRNYATVFGGYLVAGVATVISIIVSGATIAYDKPEWIQAAGVCFLVALGLLVFFLSLEVWTSFDQMWKDWVKVQLRE